MAFTDTEKTDLLFILGYSLFEDNGKAIRAINGLDNYEVKAGHIIRDLIEKIKQCHGELMNVIPLAQAISTGSTQIRAHYTLDQICRLGRTFVNQLATFTKIAIFSDIFSTGGAARTPQEFYSGDPTR